MLKDKLTIITKKRDRFDIIKNIRAFLIFWQLSRVCMIFFLKIEIY